MTNTGLTEIPIIPALSPDPASSSSTSQQAGLQLKAGVTKGARVYRIGTFSHHNAPMASRGNALPQWLPSDHRTVARWPIDLPADLSVRDRTGTIAVKVGDISTLGCLLVVPEPLAVGWFVCVALPGRAPLEGWVAWCKQGHAGIDFAQPITDAEVDAIIG